jgi:hypothetical protein
VKRDSAAQNGNDFSIVRHFRGKINYGDKSKKGTEQVGEIRNKIEVIVGYNLLRGNIF